MTFNPFAQRCADLFNAAARETGEPENHLPEHFWPPVGSMKVLFDLIANAASAARIHEDLCRTYHIEPSPEVMSLKVLNARDHLEEAVKCALSAGPATSKLATLHHEMEKRGICVRFKS